MSGFDRTNQARQWALLTLMGAIDLQELLRSELADLEQGVHVLQDRIEKEFTRRNQRGQTDAFDHEPERGGRPGQRPAGE